MPPFSSTAKDFFDLARREAHRYGRDPWVFLRELVQNSRDAAASQIHFSVKETPDWQMIICEDNGEGMSPYVLENYLLRLYASSKETDAAAVGFFGVGFWSILLFKPDLIRITTRQGSETRAFEIDPQKGILRPGDGVLHQNGTRISLYRHTTAQGEHGFLEAARQRLLHYTAHVRPTSSSARLDLYYNGEPVNQPFPEPDIIGKHLKTEHFDGYVGFGSVPSVRLYKGGILVRDLLSMDEIIPSRPKGALLTPGLNPVVCLNVEGLQVLMDRRKIFEDPLLHQLVDTCEQALSRLSRRLLEKMLPISLKNRIRLLSGISRLKIMGGLLLALALLFLPGLLQRESEPFPPIRIGEGRTPPRAEIGRAMDQWHGDQKPPEGDGAPYTWDFSYWPTLRHNFRLRTFDRFDVQHGLKPSLTLSTGTYLSSNLADAHPIDITMRVSPERNILPLPPFYRVLEGTVVLGTDSLEVTANQFGEPFVLPESSGELHYTAVYDPDPSPPQVVVQAPIDWPADYAGVISQAAGKSPREAAELFNSYLGSTHTYTREPLPETEADWLVNLSRHKQGDCDVLNGLLVMMLRGAGVPAHLSVGLVGIGGEAAMDLHAWVRYYDEGWRLMDVTVHPGLEHAHQPVTAPLPAAPAAVGEPPSVGATGSAPGTGYGKLWLGLLAFVGLGCFILYRRLKPAGMSLDEGEKQRYLANLVKEYLAGSEAGDPMNLRFRALFPRHGGKPLSLIDIEELLAAKRLFAARADCDLLPRLKHAVVLDRGEAVVGVLTSFLPAIVWLEDVAPLFHHHELPPFLQDAVQRIRAVEPSYQILIRKGDACFRELALPTNPITRLQVLGDNHPLYQKASAWEGDGILTAALLVHASVFFLANRDEVLLAISRGQKPGEVGA